MSTYGNSRVILALTQQIQKQTEYIDLLKTDNFIDHDIGMEIVKEKFFINQLTFHRLINEQMEYVKILKINNSPEDSINISSELLEVMKKQLSNMIRQYVKINQMIINQDNYSKTLKDENDSMIAANTSDTLKEQLSDMIDQYIQIINSS